MIATSQVCDSCRRPVGNRITVVIDDLLICSLPCGIQLVGKPRYLKAWTDRCIEISAGHMKSNLKSFRRVK